MNLPKRLECIVSLTPRSRCVCDIGCDHAYTAIELLRRGRAEQVLACDIHEGPLRQARRNVELAGLGERIELRRGDGLAPVAAGEAETVICAGMGGALICRILEERTADFRHFVLSPQSEPERVRRFLLRRGIGIRTETLLEEDGKYYLILIAGAGDREQEGCEAEGAAYSEAELRYGRQLLMRRDSVLYTYLLSEKARYEGILKRTEKPEVQQAYRYCLEALRRYGDGAETDSVGEGLPERTEDGSEAQ